MECLAPPPTPPDGLKATGYDGIRRVQFRLWLMLITMVTVAITAWFMTFGAIPGILALMVAKHVLVAVLVRGLDINISPRERPLCFVERCRSF